MTDGKEVRAVLYKRIGISLLAVAIAVSLTACGFLSIPSAVQELLSSRHQENKDQTDGKPLSLFWAEDGDLGWKNGELLYTADWDYLYLSGEDAAAYL